MMKAMMMKTVITKVVKKKAVMTTMRTRTTRTKTIHVQLDDQALYDRVLEMREKRLDQEDVLNDFKKSLEDIKKSHDRMVIKQKNVDKELIATERDIVKFQTEKRRD